MTTIAISMVKNESDIIVPVVQHMLTQVDHVIVADNLSTDNTRELLEGIGSPKLTIVDDDDPAYYQSKKMTALAQLARQSGADWVVPFDADEVWYSDFGTISEVLGTVADRVAVVKATLYDHVPSAEDNEFDSNPITRIQWRRRDPAPLPKVACRADERLVIEQGNHGANYGYQPHAEAVALVIRHFPYRSREQMVRKAIVGDESLQLTDLPQNSGAHWRGYAAIARDNEENLHGVFDEYFWSADPRNDATLILDPAPARS